MSDCPIPSFCADCPEGASGPWCAVCPRIVGCTDCTDSDDSEE